MYWLCLTNGVLNDIFNAHCSKGQQQTRHVRAQGLTSAGAENLSHLVQVNHFAQATKLQFLSLWAGECEWRFFLWTLGMFSGTTKRYVLPVEGAVAPKVSGFLWALFVVTGLNMRNCSNICSQLTAFGFNFWSTTSSFMCFIISDEWRWFDQTKETNSKQCDGIVVRFYGIFLLWLW